jgi:hypothetical protein
MTDTENRLQEQVDHIAECLTTGEYDFDPEYSDYDEPNAFDYLKDVLDIEYAVNSNKEYLGARVLVAFGGPNIWINTRTNTVEGYWWTDKATAGYTDDLGIDECLEELFHCC